eukprot:29891-Amphidinium_carterae.1
MCHSRQHIANRFSNNPGMFQVCECCTSRLDEATLEGSGKESQIAADEVTIVPARMKNMRLNLAKKTSFTQTVAAELCFEPKKYRFWGVSLDQQRMSLGILVPSTPVARVAEDFMRIFAHLFFPQ